MKKADVIDVVADAASIPKKSAAIAVEALLDCIRDSLVAKEAVNFAGFGSFDISHRAERKGHNPHTGESMLIPASYALKFKASKKLKDYVNQASEER